MNPATRQPVAAVETAPSVVIRVGRDTSRRPFSVGSGQPLRVVAPFGWTAASDTDTDLSVRVRALANAGADAVHELSTFGRYAELRHSLVASSPIPYGTVLAYEFVDRSLRNQELTEGRAEGILLEVLRDQIDQGVDYITVHASHSRALARDTAEARARRAIALPSRAAAMLNRVMDHANIDNPLHVHFDRIAEHAAAAGVVISLGGSYRPAAFADAMDSLHRAEIDAQGRLAQIAHARGAQVMLEGLSHALPEDDKESLCPGHTRLRELRQRRSNVSFRSAREHSINQIT